MKVTHLIIHCSDSPFGDAEVIRKWHTDPEPEGRGWSDIGYHYVILNGHPTTTKTFRPETDGAVQKGRADDVDGSHAQGFNHCALGICLVGTTTFTPAQMESLYRLATSLMRTHHIPVEHVLGHCEIPLSHGKTCPNLSLHIVRSELAKRLG